jgi:hypothetical protein
MPRTSNHLEMVNMTSVKGKRLQPNMDGLTYLLTWTTKHHRNARGNGGNTCQRLQTHLEMVKT